VIDVNEPAHRVERSGVRFSLDPLLTIVKGLVDGLLDGLFDVLVNDTKGIAHLA
jgi:hypothetical protein